MVRDDFYSTLARQLIRQVRGRRSQNDLSRRAGYKSNMVQRWEAGECFPHIETFFALCARQRIDVGSAIQRFYGRPPDWLTHCEPTSNAAAAALLREQKGRVALGELARRSGYNRYTLARWLKGQSRPPPARILARARHIEPETPRLRRHARRSGLAQSTASECVGLYCVQLLDLDTGPNNALQSTGSRPRRRQSTP